MNEITTELIDWSRAQFALTAMYHWIFVPLTLGLGLIMAVSETVYYKTGQVEWKNATRFWMKLFAINFAMGVATGLILEFEFGTNWSNYSWFVGDIFGAPLAIEGIIAFFMEATFIAIMFFGWEKVSRRAHLAATWLTLIGATLSAVWILVANAWMQYPVGMEYNPETMRNEMVDFWAVALSPVAINKFWHTVSSCWLLGSAFAMGVCGLYLLRKKHIKFAKNGMVLAACVGLVSTAVVGMTGHKSAENVARLQPMKLAAIEGLAEGGKGAGFVAMGLPKPGTDWSEASNEDIFARVEFPKVLSLLATGSLDGFVPGIQELLKGGFETEQGVALSAEEKIRRGRLAIAAQKDFSEARAAKDEVAMADARARLKENFKYFGYGYLKSKAELVPPVPLVFYSFRVMIVMGGVCMLLPLVVLFYRKSLEQKRWLLWAAIAGVPCAYMASQAGWIVAEVGRQPWAIQDILPNCAAVSNLSATSVKTTFFIFLAFFTLLLIAEIRIMARALKDGPQS